jgi:hypothetical protein
MTTHPLLHAIHRLCVLWFIFCLVAVLLPGGTHMLQTLLATATTHVQVLGTRSVAPLQSLRGCLSHPSDVCRFTR